MPQGGERDEPHADDDRDIGDVEDRPAFDVNEVDDDPARDAVDQIAHAAAYREGEAGLTEAVRTRPPAKHDEHDGHHGERRDGQRREQIRRGRQTELRDGAERDVWILDVTKLEKTRNDGDGVAAVECRFGSDLRRMVAAEESTSERDEQRPARQPSKEALAARGHACATRRGPRLFPIEEEDGYDAAALLQK